MAQIFQKPQLWQQLQLTAKVVLSVRSGTSGNAAVDVVPEDLRAGVQALSFHVWRHLGRAECLRRQLAPKKPPPAVDALLCTALALGCASADEASYDAFTLVNQAVEACKRQSSTKGAAHFVNACLRRFLRERDELLQAVNTDPVARWNHPAWWIARLKQDYPARWEHLLLQANLHPPMTLRVNVRHSSAVRYCEVLLKEGIEAEAIGMATVVLKRAVSVTKLPGFKTGVVSVQDAAAQLAAPMLLQSLMHHEGMRILDACAAPGGKTGHLLEMSDAHVTALEINAQRGLRISQNLERLRVSAKVVTGDAVQPETWWDGVLYDGILLDAPCSASGIVRRHPDVRWLRRETDIAQLAILQSSILRALWPLLKPGGCLLYCTCSVFRQEGIQQVDAFLANNTDATLLPSAGHLVENPMFYPGAEKDSLPSDYDGFFYALLQKRLA